MNFFGKIYTVPFAICTVQDHTDCERDRADGEREHADCERDRAECERKETSYTISRGVVGQIEFSPITRF